jgi:AcrR family transcriptional regulator
MPKTVTPAKVDPRVRRTRRLLRDALVSLILEKDYPSISIKEITERAEVAYITFFRHFDSMDELLMEVLDKGQLELMGRVETLAKQSEKPTLETEGRLIFEYIQQNADLFRVLLRSQSVSRIRKKVVRSIAAIYQRSCNPLLSSNSPVTVEIAANHIATSLLSLIEWWLENRLSPPPSDMGKIYKSLIVDSTMGAVRSLSNVMARA